MNPIPQVRQKAYSDGHIQLPQSLAFTDIGLPLDDHMNDTKSPIQYGFRRLHTISSSLELMATEELPLPERGSFQQITESIHRGALHFTFHLLLISLFETLFFWQFVSQQEDGALTGLVNTYTNRAFSTCASMTPQERTNLRMWVSTFLNTSTVLDQAAIASKNRDTFNTILLRNSWLYFGGLTTIFGILTSTAILRRLCVQWRHLLTENMCMVILLGLYEWMFFHTVALRYQAVTPAELDGLIVTEFQMDC